MTQKEHPHFAFDIGMGQVAGNIGTTYYNPPGTTVLVPLPVNIDARHIIGLGLSIERARGAFFADRARTAREEH